MGSRNRGIRYELSHLVSDIDERIRFSQKSSEHTAPATVIQRSKHCQTGFWVKKQAAIGTHEPLPIRGGQAQDQARRQSTISLKLVGLSTSSYPIASII